MRVLKKTIILLLIFVAFKLTVLLAYVLYEHLPLQLIHFEHLAIEDVEFNDIYYAVHTKPLSANKEVVIINSGSLDKNNNLDKNEGFRKSLADLIEKTEEFHPMAIGIDFTFENRKNPIFDSILQAVITKHQNIILAKDKDFNRNIFKGVKYGIVNFPEKSGESIRHCYNFVIQTKDTLPSFALQLARVKDKSLAIKESESYLRYSSGRKGYYDILNDKKDPHNPNDIAAIEACDLMDCANTAMLMQLLSNKIVIIGHLGAGSMNNPFDIEDKFRVPTDTTLINRIPSMPGAVIIANAVQMLLINSQFFEVTGWLNTIITSIILSFFLYVFYTIHHKYKLGKVINIIIILGSTIPIIYLCCVQLMGAGIYFKVGGLFLQIAFLEEFIEMAEGFKNKFITKTNK